MTKSCIWEFLLEIDRQIHPGSLFLHLYQCTYAEILECFPYFLYMNESYMFYFLYNFVLCFSRYTSISYQF